MLFSAVMRLYAAKMDSGGTASSFKPQETMTGHRMRPVRIHHVKITCGAVDLLQFVRVTPQIRRQFAAGSSG